MIRTDSKKSSDASESESESQYVDCDDCLEDESDEYHDDVDGVFDDSNPGLEFEYEPGISLSSLHFYQTCECQNNESESGELSGEWGVHKQERGCVSRIFFSF